MSENKQLSAIDILVTELKKIGADGLYNPFAECGCGIENFFPENCLCKDCVPAKAKKENCKKCEIKDVCNHHGKCLLYYPLKIKR